MSKQDASLRYAIHWRSAGLAGWQKDTRNRIMYFFSPDAAREYADQHLVLPYGGSYSIVEQAQIRRVADARAY